MTTPTEDTTETDPVLVASATDLTGNKPGEFLGRTPGQIAWSRFKRNRIGVLCAGIVIFFFLIAIFAPVISALYGQSPFIPYGLRNPSLLDDYGVPIGPGYGMNAQHWFGLTPNNGYDIFIKLIYGIRTSLGIGLIVTIVSSILGISIGVAQGYLGGRFDYFVGRFSDLLLGLPSQLFFIAFTPIVLNMFVPADQETPIHIRIIAIVLVQTVLGWMATSRLLRGLALSLREREYIEAAKIAGASSWRIIFKELMPNLATTMLVQVTLLLPAMVTAEAGLSYLGVGMVEPTPDWGLMFLDSVRNYQNDLTYLLFPGLSLMVFSVAFSLFGDAIRDALDPKTIR
ncbi:peptide/nickel transport system permease protein [Kitasatospora sp. MAP12-15]|uniref:ABC transporter permease n=1 Tax=unclassified Kitasatospora TaxID=2633591 RepID=UPI0024763350|nr:ABC transporter permease [Kitasatospora sp. MAP12-44]MDH6112633.1 peptide/nickel transport system permease protein [Kitasatospora sp. MAP12-44]